jgi:branched-chain amino acid transport system ATP-binding protein
MGVLIIEHDVELLVTICDSLHVLDFGRTIASGRPADVQHDEAVRRAYMGTLTVDLGDAPGPATLRSGQASTT